MSVTNVKVTPSSGTLAVSWTLPAGAYAALVKWREHPSGAWSIALATAACEITGLHNGVRYDVQVIALTGSGTVTATGTPAGTGPPNPVPPGPVVH